MHRQLVYPGAIPLETDLLYTNRFAYTAIAKLAGALFGTNTLINGGAVTATSPASLSVQVAPCEIYSLQNLDNSAYSSLPIDTTHQIVKQGLNLDAVTLSCPAPGTVGYSVNYLIEYGFSETDAGSTVLPYYNAANPAQAYAGPNNSGAPNYTYRQNTVNIQVKAGIAATTGSQTTPSPDSGFVGGYVVTVAYGQTTITSGNIALYTGAPFLSETLLAKISQATGDARYAQIAQVQNGSLIYGTDTGTANAYAAIISPALTSYTSGAFYFIKIANANTGAGTLNLNSLGAKNIKLTNGINPNSGDLIAGMCAIFFYDGTNMQLLNPATITFSAKPVQNNSFTYYADTGTANAYVATLTPAITSYVAGLEIELKIANTNTSAMTALNVNGLGATPIKLVTGSNANVGDIFSGMIGKFIFDGTNFQLLNPATLTSQSQVQSGSLVYAADTGTANNYAISLSPPLISYSTGMHLLVRATSANTGASTLNVNGLGAKSILREDGSALQSGDIPSGKPILLFYDGVEFLLLGTRIQQFGSLMNTIGYQKLPSGLIIQWLNITGVTSGTVGGNGYYSVSVTNNWPIAFPNNVFSAVHLCQDVPGNVGETCIYASLTTSSISINLECLSANSTMGARIISIGN